MWKTSRLSLLLNVAWLCALCLVGCRTSLPPEPVAARPARNLVERKVAAPSAVNPALSSLSVCPQNCPAGSSLWSVYVSITPTSVCSGDPHGACPGSGYEIYCQAGCVRYDPNSQNPDQPIPVKDLTMDCLAPAPMPPTSGSWDWVGDVPRDYQCNQMQGCPFAMPQACSPNPPCQPGTEVHFDGAQWSCQSCSAIDPNCTACALSQCTACAPGSVLDSAQNTCVTCQSLVPNCGTCSATECLSCAPGAFPSGSGSSLTCTPCVDRFPWCTQCNSGQCQACLPGFVLVEAVGGTGPFCARLGAEH